jgi:hypothetical protein
MSNKLTNLILGALLFLLFAACNKDDSTDDVSIHSFEYSATTNHYTQENPIQALALNAETGVIYKNPGDPGDTDGQMYDLYVEADNEGLDVVIDHFSSVGADDDNRPRFVYSSFSGDIDKINHPSELPQNLPENLEWMFRTNDKSICYVLYLILEYTVPNSNSSDEDFSSYKGKYKLGKPQFLFQITEMKQYDYQYNATTKYKCADYKIRTKYFDYK